MVKAPFPRKGSTANVRTRFRGNNGPHGFRHLPHKSRRPARRSAPAHDVEAAVDLLKEGKAEAAQIDRLRAEVRFRSHAGGGWTEGDPCAYRSGFPVADLIDRWLLHDTAFVI